MRCCYAWGLDAISRKVARIELIFDNSAVDLFWFRPARDRDRQVAEESGNRQIDHEPFYSQTDRISSEIPEHSTSIGLTAGVPTDSRLRAPPGFGPEVHDDPIN